MIFNKEEEVPTNEVENLHISKSELSNKSKDLNHSKNEADMTKSESLLRIMDEEENIFHFPKIHQHSNKKKKREHIKMKNSSTVFFSKIYKQSSTSKEERKTKTNKTLRSKMILPQVSLGQQDLIKQATEQTVMCSNTTSDGHNKSRSLIMTSSKQSLACFFLNESCDNTKDTRYDAVKNEDSLIELIVSGKSLKF